MYYSTILMDFNLIFILISIGICTGFFSGLVGTGGGLIMVPLFVLFLELNQHQAQGLSLAVMLPPVTFLAVRQYHKKQKINFKIAGLLSLFLIIGSFFGSKIALLMNQDILQIFFGIIVFLVALKMIFK